MTRCFTFIPWLPAFATALVASCGGGDEPQNLDGASAAAFAVSTERMLEGLSEPDRLALSRAIDGLESDRGAAALDGLGAREVLLEWSKVKRSGALLIAQRINSRLLGLDSQGRSLELQFEQFNPAWESAQSQCRLAVADARRRADGWADLLDRYSSFEGEVSVQREGEFRGLHAELGVAKREAQLGVFDPSALARSIVWHADSLERIDAQVEALLEDLVKMEVELDSEECVLDPMPPQLAKVLDAVSGSRARLGALAERAQAVTEESARVRSNLDTTSQRLSTLATALQAARIEADAVLVAVDDRANLVVRARIEHKRLQQDLVGLSGQLDALQVSSNDELQVISSHRSTCEVASSEIFSAWEANESRWNEALAEMERVAALDTYESVPWESFDSLATEVGVVVTDLLNFGSRFEGNAARLAEAEASLRELEDARSVVIENIDSILSALADPPGELSASWGADFASHVKEFSSLQVACEHFGERLRESEAQLIAAGVEHEQVGGEARRLQVEMSVIAWRITLASHLAAVLHTPFYVETYLADAEGDEKVKRAIDLASTICDVASVGTEYHYSLKVGPTQVDPISDWGEKPKLGYSYFIALGEAAIDWDRWRERVIEPLELITRAVAEGASPLRISPKRTFTASSPLLREGFPLLREGHAVREYDVDGGTSHSGHWHRDGLDVVMFDRGGKVIKQYFCHPDFVEAVSLKAREPNAMLVGTLPGRPPINVGPRREGPDKLNMPFQVDSRSGRRAVLLSSEAFVDLRVRGRRWDGFSVKRQPRIAFAFRFQAEASAPAASWTVAGLGEM